MAFFLIRLASVGKGLEGCNGVCMAFIPAVGCARLEMVFEEQGQIIENVFHFESGTAWDVAHMTALALAVKNEHTANIRALQTAGCSLTKIRVRGLNTDADPAIEYTTGLPVAGLGGATPAPMNVTLAVKLSTGLGGRSFRGRFYFCGLDLAVISGSTVAGGFITDLITAYGRFLTTEVAAAGQWGVVSYVHDHAPRTTGAFTPIIGLSADTTTDSQRRRLPGRGS